MFGWLKRLFGKNQKPGQEFGDWEIFFRDGKTKTETSLGKATGGVDEVMDEAQLRYVNFLWKNGSMQRGEVVFGEYYIKPVEKSDER